MPKPTPDEEEVINPDEEQELDPGTQPEPDDEPEELEEEQEEQPEEESEEPEEEPQPSRRQQLRIDQLLDKLRDKESGTPSPTQKSKALDFEDIDADEETLTRLKDDRSSYGDARYAEGMQQADAIKFQTRLEIDAPKVESKHPELDKESEEWNPVLASTVNRMYLNMVGYDEKTGNVQNADVRYADFIESIFELSDEVSRRNVATATKNITSQAAKTGIRPDGSKSKSSMNLNKAPEDMTDEELDAVIKAALPSLKR